MKMIKDIKDWIKNRKREKEQRNFNRAFCTGYNYAAGTLLRGEESPFSLESYAWLDLYTPFDKGVSEATDRLVEAGVVKDNRM